MSLPELQHPGYTLKDWESWEGAWELINGVAYDMTPAPNVQHQEILTNLLGAIWSALREGVEGDGNCKVLVAPTDVFLGETVVQPDLLVVCDPAKVTPRGIVGAPDLVVEVLSPRTASKDTVQKRWIYEAAGVPEYLIVAPDERVAELLRLDGQGRYQTAARLVWGEVMGLLGGRLSIVLG